MVTKPVRNKILIGFLLLLIAGGITIWYLFTLKFDDTKALKADYKLDAMALIEEFSNNDSVANRKYTEKILQVRGKVTEIGRLDSSITLKMEDSATGSYLIFAFQSQSMKGAKNIKVGEEVSVKGSCSGGVYSQILDARYISFKRCVIIKQ